MSMTIVCRPAYMSMAQWLILPKEERVLIADPQLSRGWEARHLLLVYGLENLVMRTVGYLV